MVSRIACSASAPTVPARQAFPSPAPVTTSPTWKCSKQRGFVVDVRFNWFTLYFRYNTIDTYFGTSHYTIDFSGEQPLIMKKKVVLKNDYIHHVVDIYHF